MEVCPSTPTATRAAPWEFATATSEKLPSEVICAVPVETRATFDDEKPGCSFTSRHRAL